MQIGPHRFDARPLILAGPCAVEDERQLLEIAEAVREAGADVLRGGAFKPRTRPQDFQGLGREGVELLARAREESGLPIVTEALDEASLALVEAAADIVQVGARNMHNFSLLKQVGRSGKPVLLKRGFSAELDEWLHAAEYIEQGGASEVLLCERGIRTFSRHSRFTLDLSVIPVLQRRSRHPIVVDPSHATGEAASVAAMARAAVAAGADAVMIEVHADPDSALCDGVQALRPAELSTLIPELRDLAERVAELTP